MNHNLQNLHPYPFAKMSNLLADSSPSDSYSEIKLGIGEPKHSPPAFVLDILQKNLDRLSYYPTTNGSFELRQTIAHWLEKRFFLRHVDAHQQVLPVMGTREAIFRFVQAVVSTTKQTPEPTTVMPNPFYQIY